MVHHGNKLSPATATLFSQVKTKKTRVKDNADGCGLLFLSYNFIMGDLYLLFLQTCKGITFIEKFDLTNNVYLMSDKDILCESLSTLLQYTIL